MKQGRKRKEPSQAYLAHLQSPYWAELRRDVLARAEGRCEMCREKPITQVHHLHYRTLGHETLNDVLGLCSRCHRYTHGLLPSQSRRAKRRSNARKLRNARRLLSLTRGESEPPPKRPKPFPNLLPPKTDWSFRETLLKSLDR